MSSGTITLTNNSDEISGNGTLFTSSLKPGDMIVAVAGGVTYTLPVKTIDSDTRVTIIRAYDGPTQSGAAWSAVPRETLNRITAQLAAETSMAIRGLNYDKANWQQVFSGTGDITVRLPDGSTFTGPSWGGFTNTLNTKATIKYVDEGLSKKVNKTDVGDSAGKNVGTTAGTVAAGDDARLNTINNKTGGLVKGIVSTQGNTDIFSDYCTAIGWNSLNGVSEIVNNRGLGAGGISFMIASKGNGVISSFSMSPYGTFSSPAGVYTVNNRVLSFTGIGGSYLTLLVDGVNKGISFFDSDENLKENIKDVPSGAASEIIRNIRPVSYKFKDSGTEDHPVTGAVHDFGVIAQEIEKILPHGIITMPDGKKSLEPLEIFGLLLTAQKELLQRVERLEKKAGEAKTTA